MQFGRFVAISAQLGCCMCAHCTMRLFPVFCVRCRALGLFFFVVVRLWCVVPSDFTIRLWVPTNQVHGDGKAHENTVSLQLKMPNILRLFFIYILLLLHCTSRFFVTREEFRWAKRDYFSSSVCSSPLVATKAIVLASQTTWQCTHTERERINMSKRICVCLVLVLPLPRNWITIRIGVAQCIGGSGFTQLTLINIICLCVR